MRVVIVDDNTDIKELYEIAFRGSEFDLTFITSSLEAISYLDNNPADVVLIDLAMREMDGLTLAREIRVNEDKNDTPPARLAWFTAKEITDADRRVAKRYDVEEVFAKPTDPQSLILKLRAWLNESEVQKEVVAPERQNGSAFAVMTVSLAAIVVLIVVITVYNRVLHSSEEAAAYRFAEQKNRANQMKTVCDNNAKTSSALKVWIEQQNLKPPPELLVSAPCVVVIEKE